MAFDASTLAQAAVLNLVPNGSEGGIWMSGAGPAADASGNVYLLEGNGTFDTTLDANGFPSQGDFGNAFVKLSTSGSLRVGDYFTMSNTVSESANDDDLGSGGALVLPDLLDDSGNLHHLALGAGKDSIIYVVDRDQMGKFDPNTNHDYQEVALPAGVFSMPAYFNSTVYFGAVGDSIKAFSITNAKLSASPTSQTANSFGYPGVTPAVSANGSMNGILWAVENSSTAILHAYDATNLGTELYNSNQAASGRDQFGAGNKFITPIIANGTVFVGTPNGVAAFGLLQPIAPVTTLGDLNGDGNADIVWRNLSTGENFLWLMNGASLAGTNPLPQISDASWQIVGIGDFDGDGKADILWHNRVTGDNYLWLMNGSQITASGYLPNVGNLNWQIVGVGDFNGDGKADILWRNTSTGENYLWLMNGLSLLNNGPLPTIADQHWQVAGVADFNNDGKADILWRNVSTGENYMWLMNGLSLASSGSLPQIADLSWQVDGVGKFSGANNGAGILWRRNSTGEIYMWLMNGTSIASSGPLPTIADLSWQIVGVGDLDGDGTADILWRNGSTGDNYLWLMNGLTLTSGSSLPAVNLSWQLE
jgi:hypothetical protein